MAHSPHYEARLDAAWRDLYATLDAVLEALETPPPSAHPEKPSPRSPAPSKRRASSASRS